MTRHQMGGGKFGIHSLTLGASGSSEEIKAGNLLLFLQVIIFDDERFIFLLIFRKPL